MEATSLHTKMQIKGQMNPAFESVLNTEARKGVRSGWFWVARKRVGVLTRPLDP